MALQPNQRLGPYEILSAIGAGGMGEVYRARDTRLDRIVAIKILPDQHAARPELHERFEREARTIASLNHPHICVLYEIGHQDGTDYLVMEYLEGETLAERLKKGPLPLEQVLQYAIEISDALDKAHRKGITALQLSFGNRPMEAVVLNGSPPASMVRSRLRFLRMGDFSPLPKVIPPQVSISGYYGSTIARRSRSSRSRPIRPVHSFRRTDAGWHMSPTNRTGTKFMCSRIPNQAGSTKSRLTEGPSRCGTATAVSCSIATGTR